jgi:hypothetical protein
MEKQCCSFPNYISIKELAENPSSYSRIPNLFAHLSSWRIFAIDICPGRFEQVREYTDGLLQESRDDIAILTTNSCGNLHFPSQETRICKLEQGSTRRDDQFH